MPPKFVQTKLLIASGNQGKVMEITSLLSGFNVSVLPATDFDIKEPEETGKTFKENAELKARHYGKAAGIPALADDSGLAVEALNGDPGIYSARWAGDEKNFNKAMQRIENELADNANKKAKFVCALSLYWPDTDKIATFEGEVQGTLTFPAKGEEGFGYDPIFVPDGYKKTFAEIPRDEKQKISHRAKAFTKLIENCFR